MKKTLLIALGLVLVAAFTLNCCGRAIEKAFEKGVEARIEKESGEKVDIDLGEGKIEIVGEEGTVVIGAEADIPANFPPELIYPGAKTSTSSMSISGSGTDGSGGMYTFQTDASFAAVKGFYGSLTSKGWNQISVINSSEGGDQVTIYTYQKSNESATITISSEGGETTIGIWYTEGN